MSGVRALPLDKDTPLNTTKNAPLPRRRSGRESGAFFVPKAGFPCRPRTSHHGLGFATAGAGDTFCRSSSASTMLANATV